jgi:hypothetical protein
LRWVASIELFRPAGEAKELQMDLSELQTRPAAEGGARLRRAQLARRTFESSPASLMHAYTDWLAQFLIALDKHELLARKALRQRQRPVEDAARARTDWARPRVGLREGGAP